MRILPSVIAAIAAFSLSLPSQQELVSLQVDNNPPADDTLLTGNWQSPPAHGQPIRPLTDFRLKVVGYEGGWSRPVLDFFVAQPAQLSEYGWLLASTPSEAGQRNYHGAVLNPTCSTYAVPGLQTFQRWVDFTTTDGTPSLTDSGVRAWSQPLLTMDLNIPGIATSERLWINASPQWAQSSHGQVHATLWQLMLAGPDRTSTWSAFSMLRYAIIEQSIYQTGGTAPAAAFFKSADWTSSLGDGWIQLMLQLFAIRSANVERPPGGFTESNSSLTTSSAPLAGVTEATKWIIRAPNEILLGTYFLTDVVLTPGQVHTFVAPQATSPFMVTFRKTGGGGVTTEAFPTPTLQNPSAYTLTVPNLAKSGNIKVQTGLMTTAKVIGQVTIDASVL